MLQALIFWLFLAVDTIPEEDLDQDTSVEVIGSSSGNVPVAKVLPVVKQEPISQQLTKCDDDSDVLCLGDYVASEIVIDDTQSADDSLIKDLEAGNSDSPHAFLNLIAGGTQGDEEEEEAQAQAQSTSKYSNRTLERLQAFEPIASRQLREDKQAMAVTPTKRDPPLPTKRDPPPPSGITTRRKFFQHRPGPRSSKRKVKTSTAVEYIDDDDSEPIGNDSETPDLDEAMNDDELSVFLSSQIIFDEQQSPLVPDAPSCSFKMVRSAEDKTETPVGNVAFIVNLQRVVFEKDFKFELYVNLPQYNIYHLLIDGNNIRPLLNINDQEFNAIIQLLNIAEKYEYNRTGAAPQYGKVEPFVKNQLDMFFSTQICFKFFQFHMNDDRIDCFDGDHLPLTHGDLTSAIDLEILQAVASISKSPLNFDWIIEKYVLLNELLLLFKFLIQSQINL